MNGLLWQQKMKNLEKDLITSFVSSINSKDTMDMRMRRAVNAARSINFHDYVIKQELTEAVETINTDFALLPAFVDLSQDQSKFTGDGLTANWNIGSAAFDTLRYAIIGKLVTVWFLMDTTSVSGNPATLSYELPASLVANKTIVTPLFNGSAGVFVQDCYLTILTGTHFIDFRRSDGSSWTNGVYGFAGSIQLEIQ
jgi:hypothetical protein